MANAPVALTLRRLQRSDVTDVVDFLAHGARLVGWNMPAIDIPFAQQSCAGIVDQGYSLGVFDGPKIAGILLILECAWFWNGNETFLRNENFFVAPEYRASRAASMLMKEAKRIAREADMPLHFLINFDGNQRTERFVEAHGFRRLGAYFEMKD